MENNNNNNNNNNNGNIDYLSSNILHKIKKNYKNNNKRSFNFKKHNRSPSDDFNPLIKVNLEKLILTQKLLPPLTNMWHNHIIKATHCSQLWIQAIKDEVNNLYNNKTMTTTCWKESYLF